MADKSALEHVGFGLVAGFSGKSRTVLLTKAIVAIQAVLQFKREFLVEQWGEISVEWISIGIIVAGGLGIIGLRSATTKSLDDKKGLSE